MPLFKRSRKLEDVRADLATLVRDARRRGHDLSAQSLVPAAKQLLTPEVIKKAEVYEEAQILAGERALSFIPADDASLYLQTVIVTVNAVSPGSPGSRMIQGCA